MRKISTRSIIKFLASLKLAVVVILALAAVTAVGTFVEAQYNAEIASKVVYRTPWMFGVLGLLAVVLIAVMVDRWPWKKRHIPFLLAHVGILILLLGAWITMEFGLDGSMRFGINESNRFVVLPQTELKIWSTFDGSNYAKIIDQPVDFYLNPPGEKTYSYPLAEGNFDIVEYVPFAIASRRVQAATDTQTSSKMGAALRFSIKNANVNVTDWLFQANPKEMVTQDLGPAKVYFGSAPVGYKPHNAILLTPTEKGVEYMVMYLDEKRKPLHGLLKDGESVQTGWMGLEFKVLQYLPKAEQVWDLKRLEAPTQMSTSAIKIRFMEKEHWLQLDDVVKFFTSNGAYFVTYGHQRADIGVELRLKKFEIGRYQGTMRAATYQSVVEVPEIGEHTISMNEPLQHKGFTFYQASFNEDASGNPIASILSVNRDPGRWLKYLGSLIICLGVVWLFVQKRRAARAQAPHRGQL